jgi:hypothetical protein
MKLRNSFNILLLIPFTFFFSIANAQLPVASTEEDPVWYYIQVLGDESDGRANRVFTASGTQVLGQAITTAASPVEKNRQLWRFEQSGDTYTVLNRASGKKLDITFNSSKGISVAALSNKPLTRWQFVKNGNYYNIKATVAPAGGEASKIYAHQANNYDNRNYVIMFENSGYNSTNNSRFQFVLYEDVSIELSSDEYSVWYFITSAKPEYRNKGITDVVNNALPDIKFSLENISANNDRQLWKAIKKSNAATDKHIHFVNKATGNLIQTHSIYNNYYYFTQATGREDQSNGWIANYLGGKQFEIYGTENDGVTRYLSASSRNQPRPDVLTGENTKDTGFAWILKKADDFSAINNLSPKPVRISVKENRIIVDGSSNYVIRNLQGIQICRNIALPAGIYFVTLDNQTFKIFVK